MHRLTCCLATVILAVILTGCSTRATEPRAAFLPDGAWISEDRLDSLVIKRTDGDLAPMGGYSAYETVYGSARIALEVTYRPPDSLFTWITGCGFDDWCGYKAQIHADSIVGRVTNRAFTPHPTMRVVRWRRVPRT